MARTSTGQRRMSGLIASLPPLASMLAFRRNLAANQTMRRQSTANARSGVSMSPRGIGIALPILRNTAAHGYRRPHGFQRQPAPPHGSRSAEASARQQPR